MMNEVYPDISEAYDLFYNTQANNGASTARLSTCTLEDVYEKVFVPKTPIIDGLLYPGTYLLAGSPKVGKSFLVEQIAFHVARGTDMWNYKVNKGTVLYLALEDNQRRIQQRFSRMFGVEESTDKLHFSTDSKYIGDGLEEKLNTFVKKNPDTRLIIIDTLQKVRGADSESDNYSYQKDYQIISRLKKFTDEKDICLLLVHHTRKQYSEDKFDMISGTNGLFGAADGAFILSKEKRTGNMATLEVCGRDQQEQKLFLEQDKTSLLWQLRKAECDVWEEPPDPLLDEIAGLVTVDSPIWQGTPTELAEKLSLPISANVLSRKLNTSASRLFNEYGVIYKKYRTHNDKMILLKLKVKEQERNQSAEKNVTA